MTFASKPIHQGSAPYGAISKKKNKRKETHTQRKKLTENQKAVLCTGLPNPHPVIIMMNTPAWTSNEF